MAQYWGGAHYISGSVLGGRGLIILVAQYWGGLIILVAQYWGGGAHYISGSVLGGAQTRFSD